ncbi:MAG TPA: DUF4255 domain-containing protein [Thermoanaerobaculia bacterium]|nr:DUF4255 domain-containing protein [Thermoanaerobaculia bacterium]
MLDYRVIADVSATLERALGDALFASVGAKAEIHDLQGNISLSPARVTLFLFETFEDASARNRPARREVKTPNLLIHKPPMALELHYLLTPWSDERKTDHFLLGLTLQFFYDHAILSGPILQGGLAGTDQALKVTLVPYTLEDRTRVWHAVQKSYRLSVALKVRVVNLVSTEVDTAKPVLRRTLDHALPEAVA